MGEDVLSQSEVESLLNAMLTGNEAAMATAVARTPAAEAPDLPVKIREKITPYDFKRPERVGKEQMRRFADAARGFRPQLCGGTVGDAAEHGGSETHQR